MSQSPSRFKRIVSFVGAPFVRAWGRLSLRERQHVYAMGLMSLFMLGTFAYYGTYFVEDAGISMAYARNAAAGEGWVTYAGGERVEGFSNPLWTFLMALGYLVGINGFVSAKLMGAVFGLACLPLSYALAKEARPQEDDHLVLLAPLLVATSTTVSAWHASGLENSLFSILLLTGIWRTLLEARGDRERFPLSALAFLGLAATRPEGIVYGAVAGFFMLVLAIRDEQRVVRKVGLWLAVFFVPYILFQAWRYSYFAWPFPNTYYAKMDGENRFQPWRWTTRGWDYLRDYLRAYHLGMFAPLIGLGLSTMKDWRKWVIALGTLVLGVFVLWNGRDGLPEGFDPDWLAWLQRHWDRSRVTAVLAVGGVSLLMASKQAMQSRLGVALIGLGALLVGAFGLPETVPPYLPKGLMAGGGAVLVLSLFVHLERDGAARGMLGAMSLVGGFFVLYSGGDWMSQWRFVSYVIIPVLVLLSVGAAELLRSLPGGRFTWVRVAWGAPLLLVLWIPNVWQLVHTAGKPVTSVNDVHQRVIYMQRVQDRMHIDRVVLFDVDMGAHMYFSDWRIVDVAGLVDVPMARHIYQKPFITEYVFEENTPTFAHQHAGWARKTKVASLPAWRDNYIEVPGYPTGKVALHIGNHVRRDVIMRPEYEGPAGRRVALDGELSFEGWHMPAPAVPQGGRLFVEYWLRAGFRDDDLQVYAVLDDGQGNRHLAQLPPAYGYIPTQDWKAADHVRTRMDFALPADLPEGDYALGFWVLDAATGQVIAPTALPKGAEPGALEGSFQFPDAVHIVSRDQATEQAERALEKALGAAQAGDCGAGFELWRQARYHVWDDPDWREDAEPELNAAVARCWAERAAQADSQDQAVAAIQEARWFDHNEERVRQVAEPLAQELVAQGDAAWAQEDAEAAYAAWRDALICDPSLSHVRKKAEEARDIRLGIQGKDKRYKPPVDRAPALNDDDQPENADDQDEQDGEQEEEEAKKPATLRLTPGKQPHELKPQRIRGDGEVPTAPPELPPIP